MTTDTPNRTSAHPVREHIRLLHAAGFTDRRIAGLAGLAPETVIGFTRPINRPGNRKGVKRRCHPTIAAAILAISPGDATPGLVDAIGSQRRVQALVAHGWPMQSVADRVGISGNHMRLLMTRPRIYGRTARAIDSAYAELKELRPERNGVTKWEADKARRRGKARRWPTPAYWAERMDVIGDEHFEPMYGITRREIVAKDANELMRFSGLDRETVAARLGVDKSYVDHAFRDHPEYAVEVAA